MKTVLIFSILLATVISISTFFYLSRLTEYSYRYKERIEIQIASNIQKWLGEFVTVER